MSNLSIFSSSGQKNSLRVGSESTRVKGGSASYLLRVKSKLGSGQGPSPVLTLARPSLGVTQPNFAPAESKFVLMLLSYYSLAYLRDKDVCLPVSQEV